MLKYKNPGEYKTLANDVRLEGDEEYESFKSKKADSQKESELVKEDDSKKSKTTKE